MPINVGRNKRDAELQEITRTDAIRYFRNQLILAKGNGAALIALYNDARDYAIANEALLATMQSLVAIENVASGVPIVSPPVLNLDKARYLKLFLQALSLWS